MKNFAKFLLFVLLVSAGISLLYDYRLKHGGLNLASGRKPESTRWRRIRAWIQSKSRRWRR